MSLIAVLVGRGPQASPSPLYVPVHYGALTEGTGQTGFLGTQKRSFIHLFIHKYLLRQNARAGVIIMTATANIYSAVSECFTQMLFLPPGILEAGSSPALPLSLKPSFAILLKTVTTPSFIFLQSTYLANDIFIYLHSIYVHAEGSSSILFRLESACHLGSQ